MAPIATDSLLRNWDFSHQSDLEAQLQAFPTPVSSVKGTHSWLEKKGWLLNSEDNLKRKLADILFSASLSFKTPPEANMAVKSVAYKLQDLVDEDLSSFLTDKIIDQILNKLNELITVQL